VGKGKQTAIASDKELATGKPLLIILPSANSLVGLNSCQLAIG